MSFTWIRSLVEYLTFLHYPKDDIKEQKRLMKKRSLTVLYSSLIMMWIVFILFLFNTGVFFSDYFVNNKTSLNSFAVLFVLLIFASCVCYSRGIWKVTDSLDKMESLKDELTALMKNNQIEFKKIVNDKDVKLVELLDMGLCKRCVHFSDSVNLIESSIGQYCNTHQSFINFYKESTSKKPEELKSIRDDYNHYYYATQLCVILNPEYFDVNGDANTLSDLSNYFISFYPDLKGANKRIKRIKRIFCKSAIVSVNDTNEVRKKKSLWMFQYILCNYLAGIETCYLLNEEQLKCHLDYVIGKYNDENKLCPIEKCYLSYNDNGNELQVASSDQILFNIIDKDFYERWYGKVIIKTRKIQKEIDRERVIVKSDVTEEVLDPEAVKKIKEIADKLNLKKEDIKQVIVNVHALVEECGTIKEFQGKGEILNDLKERFKIITKQLNLITEQSN